MSSHLTELASLIYIRNHIFTVLNSTDRKKIDFKKLDAVGTLLDNEILKTCLELEPKLALSDEETPKLSKKRK